MTPADSMIILLHTSKTMRQPTAVTTATNSPVLIEKAERLAAYLAVQTPEQLRAMMHTSPALAERTAQMFKDWAVHGDQVQPALDAFIGDIYSGLRADTFNAKDREFAQEHLRILSGLYGVLRPNDGICPYRLEMGYKFPGFQSPSLYEFWGDGIARQLPENGPIVNLSAVEYTRAVFPYIDKSRVIEPKFLTKHPKTGEPTFVVVHAKIARGAFARWLITNRVTDTTRLPEFADIGYRFDTASSTPSQPVYICDEFGGKGLSIRLQQAK